MNMTIQQVAEHFGCTYANLAQSYREGAKTLRAMQAKAEKTGKKVNHYTAEQLRQRADDQEQRARECEAMA